MGEAFAFQPIPAESAKALGVTRGKPFSSGAVFINGKYLEPPYVVERWGTGIRINQIPVTGQVLSWTDFLKTQPDVKVVKSEETAEQTVTSAPPPPPPPPPVVSTTDVSESSLDDLFDDDPKPKKPTSTWSNPSTSSVRPTAPARTKPTTTYSLEGEFVRNKASDALLERINAARTEIDRLLRVGGFICFGDSYSRIVGDKRSLMQLLEKLPELQQRSSDVQAFRDGVRAAHLVYLHEVVCDQLYGNRADYRKLRKLRTKLKKAQQYELDYQELSKPLF